MLRLMTCATASWLALATLCILVIVACGAVAAPVPKHLFPRAPSTSFPTAVGTKWVYADGSNEVTLAITKSEQTNGGIEVTIERLTEGRESPYQKMVVSPGGLVQTEFIGVKLKKPWVLLDSKHKPGDTWLDDDSDEFHYTNASNKLIGVEKVEVPAGTFEALRVETQYTVGGTIQLNHTYWYVSGVGVVKSTCQDERVLKSFVAGPNR